MKHREEMGREELEADFCFRSCKPHFSYQNSNKLAISFFRFSSYQLLGVEQHSKRYFVALCLNGNDGDTKGSKVTLV